MLSNIHLIMKKLILFSLVIVNFAYELTTNENKLCSIEQFTCHTAKEECIALNWMCDDNKDCTDGSDEAECHDTCRSDEFTCNNKKCIQRQWVCDNDDDCGDKSDELKCDSINCSHEKAFKCDEKICIISLWKCDGNNDCPNRLDEQNCDYSNQTKKLVSCSDQEVLCDDYLTCIHQSWLCDGDEDCPSGIDELTAKCKNTSCKANDFQCKINESCNFDEVVQEQCFKNNTCLNEGQRNDCNSSVSICNASKFECIDRICQSLETICNKNFDCEKRKKEIKSLCDTDECLNENGGCSQLCINLPIGYKCDCKLGYELSDNRTCIDVNECLELGTCSQICYNKEGSFKCSCVDGYAIDPNDIRRCKAIEGHASLLFTRPHDIRKIGLDLKEMTALVNNTIVATALDFVFRTGMIFWSDSSDKKIYKAPIDEGNEKEVVIDGDLIVSDGLAVDWIYNHIYWIDTQKNHINLANFDGTMKKTLIEDNIKEPKSIVLSPLNGWMFWTDWGDEARLEKAGMDGSYRTTVIDSDIKWPNGLTLDLIGKRIYWVDAKINTLSSCNYDGSNRKTVLHSSDSLKYPFSITLFEDFVYWTDWNDGTIFRANKFSGHGLKKMLSMSKKHPMTAKIYHPYKQPDGINHCQVINGHCSHLCLPKPEINHTPMSFTCACPNGLVLLLDELMCIEKENLKISNVELKDKKYFDHGIIFIVIIGGTFIGLPIFYFIIVVISEKLFTPNCSSMNFYNPVYKRIV